MPSSSGPQGSAAAVVVHLGPVGPVLTAPRAPFVRADDLGVLRGDGVFERFLVIDGRPRHLDDHLERLVRSADLTGLSVPGPDEWRAAVHAGMSAWSGPEEWEMRLVCTRGPEEGGPSFSYVLGQELTVDLLRKRRDGIAVVTVSREMPSWRASGAPWLLLGAKTLSYAVNLSAQRWARSRGADDAIFVGSDGNVWEGSSSAVIAGFGRRLVSPPPSVGILSSISTVWLFKAAGAAGWEVAREGLTVDDLYAADGLWLTSSVRGLVRVHTLDGKGLAPALAHAELVALAAQ